MATPTILSNILSIEEGNTRELSLNNLNATAEEAALDEILITVVPTSDGSLAGEFLLDGAPTLSFTLDDVDMGLVEFAHDGSNFAPSYNIIASNEGDQSAPDAAEVNFGAVNDRPDVAVNALTVAEGGAVILNQGDTVNLLTTDEAGESTAAELTYDIQSVTNGKFQKLVAGEFVDLGVGDDAFTQADVDNELIRFVHDGSELAPTYRLRVVDGGLPGDGLNSLPIGQSIRGNVTFLPNNDAPILATNELTLSEGDTVIITSTDLAATDAEDDDATLTFTITAIAGGRFELLDTSGNVVQILAAPDQAPVGFTQQQVSDGLVQFVNDPATEAAPSYSVQVSDSGRLTATADPNPDFVETDNGENSQADIDFTAINDTPVVVLPNIDSPLIDLAEQSQVVLTAADLLVTDEESNAGNLTYSVEDLDIEPAGEFLLLDAESGGSVPITSFTQADVNAGRIAFNYFGVNEAPNFELTVTDEGGEFVVITSGEIFNFLPNNDLPQIVNSSLDLIEGEMVTITAADLLVTDEESMAGELEYTVTINNLDPDQPDSFIIDGVVELGPIVTFTQQQIDDELVILVHGGSDFAPDLTISVSDTAVGGDANTVPVELDIDFESLNDLPELETLALTLTEGETVPITGAVLSVTDEESGAADITYTVDAVAGGEFLRLPTDPDGEATVATTFTQAEINAGNVIVFEHDDSNDAPTFSLTVSDGEDAIAITDADGQVNFTATNDAPTITNNALTVPEGDPENLVGITLTADNLLAEDEESSPSELTYTITIANNDPTNPDFFQVGNVIELGPEVTFTQAQVNDGLVKFFHGGSNSIATLTVTVTDTFPEGDPITTAAVPFNVDFQAENDVPVLVKNRLAINESGTVVFGPNNLTVADEETAAADLVYTIKSFTNGDFERRDLTQGTSTPLAIGNTFTQADIDGGLIQFKHDDGEAAPTYELSLVDTPLEPAGPVNEVTITSNITFKNINDDPTLTANAIEIDEGGEVILTAANLAAEDPDNPPSELRFNITNVKGGTFTFDGQPLVEGVSFTSQDLLLKELKFTDDGDEIPPSYTVTVLDSKGGVATGDAAVTLNPVNDPPEIITNTFTITEGGTLKLNDPDTPEVVNLAATDDETAPVDLVFTISNVQGGTFVDFNAQPIAEFTQSFLNQGKITFVQDGSNPVPTFDITVKDAKGEATTVAANVNFIPVNDMPEVQVSTFEITEGETVTLSAATLLTLDDVGESGPEDLTYKIEIANNDAAQPDGFEIDGVLQTGPEVTFTQAQVNAGLVKFVHGGSNTIATFAQATVTDAFPAEFGDPITVAFDLKANFTATNDLLVVENNSLAINEGQTVILATDNLLTTDEETAPENIVYTVVATTNGFFQRRNLDPDDTATTIPVDGTFTQAEVAAGLIQFVQDGAEAAPTFSLKVQDTPLTPDGEATSITFDGVIAAFENVNDAPTFTANALTVTEGGEVTVKTTNLAATDPDNKLSQLRFSISEVKGGTFFLDGVALTPEQKFSAAVIFAEELTFKDDDDEEAPTYTVTVTDQVGGTTIAPATVAFNKVNDAPKITTNAFTITETKRLTLNNPDTPTVVNLAATDPETPAADLLFQVSNVVGGQFLDFEFQPITEFTQSLLSAGEISFKQDGSETAPTFDITVVDADGGKFTEAGNVTFVPINDPPVIGKAQLTVTEGATITITGNDIAVDDPDTAPENVTITVSELSGGTFNLVVDGVVTKNVTSFTEAQVIAGQVQFVDDGNQDAPSFSVSASDGEFTSEAVAVTIVEFINTNDAPEAVPDSGDGFATDEKTAFVTANVLANDTDVDPGDVDTLFVSAIAGQNVAVGDITLASGAIVSLADEGRINYNPNGAFQLALGATDTDTFTYTVSDINGGSNTTTVTVTIVGVNDAPIAKDDPTPEDKADRESFTAPDNAPVTTRPLTDNDEDEDGDTLRVTKLNNIVAAVGVPVPLDDTDTATATLNADGSITYTPSEVFRSLAVGEVTTDSFTYTITDPSGVESTATVNILINGVNEAPTITSKLVTFDTTEGTEIDLALIDVAGITDIDINDNPNLKITSVSNASLGTITNNGRTLTYTPGQSLLGDQVETETLTYTVSDGNGGEVTGQFEIEITGIDDPPIALNDRGTGFITDEATAFRTASVLRNDFDPERGALKIVGVDTSNTRGLLVNNGNGTFTYDPNGAFNLLPVGRSATDRFSYTISDELGQTATASVSITVRGLLSTFLDFEQQLKLRNPAAIAPGDVIDVLPLAQLYDESFYLSQNRDVAAVVGTAFSSGYQHFVQSGINEGRSPSVLFNESYYRSQNRDVRDAIARGEIASGLSHFLNVGHREGRDPSAFFDQSDYLLNNPDVALAVGQRRLVSAFQHYVVTGVDEGRLPNLTLFDQRFYLASNPDIAAAGVDAYQHFIEAGQFEGRRPSALYNESSYLALNPDVAAVVNATPGLTGFQHYQQFGRFEGRNVFA